MSTLPGGPADKAGNIHETLWGVVGMMSVLGGQADAIRIEEPGTDGAEFYLDKATGHEHWQAKRQMATGAGNARRSGSAGPPRNRPEPSPRRNWRHGAIIDSIACIAYSDSISTTLTIRGLDAEVKQKLRVQAATNGRAMEAEAREILTRAVLKTKGNPPAAVAPRKLPKSVCGSVRGIWKGRMSTDEIMRLTRGELRL